MTVDFIGEYNCPVHGHRYGWITESGECAICAKLACVKGVPEGVQEEFDSLHERAIAEAEAVSEDESLNDMFASLRNGG